MTIDKIDGYVQKGPYLNGTAITISELSGSLIPTGRNFTSQIADNKGSFEIRNIELSSDFVELMANGFYFNEVLNESSSAQLTLFALSDLSDKTSVNVNILSSLEKGRVQYLISDGLDFQEAKKQAQAEILKIFEIEIPVMNESENLDISQEGEENAALLAISLIMQGYLTVAELSELIANFNTDIKEDGILNSESLGSCLINNAKMLKPGEIRENLEARYEALGFNAVISDFESYISTFIDSTDFVFTNNIEYPDEATYGENILYSDKSIYIENHGFSVSPADFNVLSAFLPTGSSIRIVIESDFYNSWFGPSNQNETSSGMRLTLDSPDYTGPNSRWELSSVRTGKIEFIIGLSKNLKLKVYENNGVQPVITKEIEIEN